MGNKKFACSSVKFPDSKHQGYCSIGVFFRRNFNLSLITQINAGKICSGTMKKQGYTHLSGNSLGGGGGGGAHPGFGYPLQNGLLELWL